MKTFNIQYNIGKVKYVINDYDGVSTHKDGSKFYGIHTFHNKKKFEACIKSLKAQGYVEE